jgi:autotransporter-associated beta strand protein
MKNQFYRIFGFATVLMLQPASATIIYSGFLNTTIPLDFTGTTLSIDGGMINLFFGGVGVANNDSLQPFRAGTDNLDTLLNFSAGTTLDATTLSLSNGYGGSEDHVGSTFTAGQEGYLGFKLNGTDYGWMRVVFTDNTANALIKDWAYDDAGGSLVVGAVHQDGRDFKLTSGSTLGSVIYNSGGVTNLIKSGAGTTTTLTEINTYTGASTVSSGVLKIAGAGRINSSSGVTVAAGAKFVYSSNTALAIGLTLSGNGTANRAVLGGAGTINTAVTLDNLGDTLSPGESPGIQSYTPAQTWSSFSYDWEIKSFTGTNAGTDFDQIVLGNTLHLSGGTGSYVLNVLGLNAEDLPGEVSNFSEINRSWTVLTSTGSITGFNINNWTIITDGFSNADTGEWALGLVGNNLVVSYAVPEPNALFLGGLCLLFLFRRKRSNE